LIIEKENGEIIPIFIEQLSGENPKINWENILKRSKNEKRKFCIWTNLQKWKVYYINPPDDLVQKTYMIIEIDDIKTVKKKKLKPLVRVLLAVCAFDLKNLLQKRKIKEGFFFFHSYYFYNFLDEEFKRRQEKIGEKPSEMDPEKSQDNPPFSFKNEEERLLEIKNTELMMEITKDEEMLNQIKIYRDFLLKNMK